MHNTLLIMYKELHKLRVSSCLYLKNFDHKSGVSLR